MFVFGKKKRYSIGEKIRYFDNIINDPNSNLNRKNWALIRKNDLLSIQSKINFGDVFVVDDRIFGNTIHKPRLVVVAKVKNNKVNVVPVRKSNQYIVLSNFDGKRFLNLKKAKKISKNILYEKPGFRISKNADLTYREKQELEKKSKLYIP